MNDQQKSAIAERLAVAEHCLLEGADEYLQVKLAFEKFYCFVCSTLRHISNIYVIQVMAVATSMMKTLAMG